jgi:hypothetical protein
MPVLKRADDNRRSWWCDTDGKCGCCTEEYPAPVQACYAWNRLINGDEFDETATKVIDVQWMTLPDGQSLGFVMVDNGYERKVYVGLGGGLDEDADKLYISRHGAKVYPERLLPFLSRAYPQKLDLFCPKCGVQLIHEAPVTCIGCGVRIEKITASEEDPRACT